MKTQKTKKKSIRSSSIIINQQRWSREGPEKIMDPSSTLSFEAFDPTLLLYEDSYPVQHRLEEDSKEASTTRRAKKIDKKTECPECLSYVLPRELNTHIKYHCEARLVRCRFYPQCQCPPFPANDREEHEKKFCKIASKTRKILRHKKGPLPCSRCGSTDRPHLQCPNELVSCSHCTESVLRRDMSAHLEVCSILVKRQELSRLYRIHATETTTCPMCGNKNILRKALHRHQLEECPMRLVSCQRCSESVAFQNMSSHLLSRCTLI